MKYCVACVLPDTRPNLVLGEDGVCNACRTHSEKKAIDWDDRKRMFDRLVEGVKANSRGYDCVIPVSGGKDSTWQVVQCLEYGLKPLTVTWRTPARTEIGRKNLENLIQLGVDHIDYRINPKVESRFMLKALERYGSTAIPMHLALFNIPLKVAVSFGIPLVVWGENSATEYGSADQSHLGYRLDAAWYRTYGATHGTTAGDWVDAALTAKNLSAYFGPDIGELEARNVHAVFLGHYFPWDPQSTMTVARAHGFRPDPDGPRTGYYDFADIDDEFISIHHWLKWYKFGFTRLFDNLSLEIRNRRLTRTQAVDIIRKTGDQTPYEDIGKFCAFAGIDLKQFFEICDAFRNRSIWSQHEGKWMIPSFLISDWTWT